MGEAKRKSRWTAREGVKEAILIVTIVLPWNIPHLFRKGEVGALKAIAGILDSASKASPGIGPLCLTCDQEFGPTIMPAAFTYIRVDNPIPDDQMLVSALCETCLKLPNPEFDKKMLAAYQKLDPSTRAANLATFVTNAGTA